MSARRKYSPQRVSQLFHPDRHWARLKVSDAVKSGRMPKASTLTCFDCGLQAHEYDHYRGYAPEDVYNVQPVCRACHGRRRRMVAALQKPTKTGKPPAKIKHPNKEVPIQIGVRISPLMHRELRRFSYERNTSITALVVAWVTDAMNRINERAKK